MAAAVTAGHHWRICSAPILTGAGENRQFHFCSSLHFAAHSRRFRGFYFFFFCAPLLADSGARRTSARRARSLPWSEPHLPQAPHPPFLPHLFLLFLISSPVQEFLQTFFWPLEFFPQLPQGFRRNGREGFGVMARRVLAQRPEGFRRNGQKGFGVMVRRVSA